MNREGIAKYVSFILGPQVWFPVLILIFILKTGLKQQQIFILFPLLVIFQILVPLAVLYWFISKKQVSDWDIRNRKERYKILPIFIISTLIALVAIYYSGTQLFFNMYIILWIVALVGVIVTYKWKISLHLILNTAAVIIVNFLFDWKLPILYLLIPIISWARYYHKHHTFSQIIVGILLSGTIVLIAFKYLRYI